LPALLLQIFSSRQWPDTTTARWASTKRSWPTGWGWGAPAANTIPTEFNDEKAGGRHHWVPEPAVALGKERHKTLPGKARTLGIG
jgi:hypothetical protein